MRIKQALGTIFILFIALVVISCYSPIPEPTRDDIPPTTKVTPDMGNGIITPTDAATEQEEDRPATAEVISTEAIDLQTLVTTLDDVKSAVIRIEAQGTIVDPEFGVYSGPVYGSGFIIDPSGLAITNNHVVSGENLLKVWVGSDTTKSYTARTLAVSECSDLALIEIEGTEFPFLQWYPDPITDGLEIYAAGFPSGDPEYTLSKGTISDEQASGDSRWASIDRVIEHDAKISPGNSGGPLITGEGQIVGVNYASYEETSDYFAIGRDAAIPIIEEMKKGDNVDSLGINSFATSNADGSLAGIWVSSVKSGSPADVAGIEPGDLITTLEGVALADDGSMTSYCDIIHTQGDENILGMEIIRLSSNETLEGQFNGQALSVTGTFGDPENTDDTNNVDTQLSGGPYSDPGIFSTDLIVDVYDDGYMAITDDFGALSLEVPASWNQIDGTLWAEYWGDLYFEAAQLAAAPDLEAFFSNKENSGVMLSASEDWGAIGGYIQLLDGVKHWYSPSCVWKLRQEFTNMVYEGAFDFWDCGSDVGTVAIATRPIANPTAYLALIQVQGVTDLDEDALERIMDTFYIIDGYLP